MNIEKHRAFIESLEGETGLPEKFYRLLILGVDVWRDGDEILGAQYTDTNEPAWIAVIPSKIGSLVTSNLPCRRAESRQIPDLKERVKELVRDAMDAAQGYQTDIQDGVINVPYRELRNAFRALCEPEKDSEE